MNLIFNNNSESYQTKSGDFINFHELKCHLQGKKQSLSILINRKLLSSLPPIKRYNLATYRWGEYQELSNIPPDYDNIELTIEFNDNGIIFFVWFNINTRNGNVDLSFIRWSVLTKQFILPNDLTDENLIKSIKREKVEYIPQGLTRSTDALLKYIVDKYLKSFEDWLDTLAALPKKAICNNCIHNYKYIISGQCEKYLYSKIKKP